MHLKVPVLKLKILQFFSTYRSTYYTMRVIRGSTTCLALKFCVPLIETTAGRKTLYNGRLRLRQIPISPDGVDLFRCEFFGDLLRSRAQSNCAFHYTLSLSVSHFSICYFISFLELSATLAKRFLFTLSNVLLRA